MTEDKCLNGRLDVGCYGHVYGDLSGAGYAPDLGRSGSDRWARDRPNRLARAASAGDRRTGRGVLGS